MNKPTNPTPSRYQWTFMGVTFDFYRLCEILGIISHAQAHALKKVIRAGRGDKPLVQDIDEAVDSLRRWREMVAEDAIRQGPPADLKPPISLSLARWRKDMGIPSGDVRQCTCGGAGAGDCDECRQCQIEGRRWSEHLRPTGKPIPCAGCGCLMQRYHSLYGAAACGLCLDKYKNDYIAWKAIAGIDAP